MMAVHKIKLVDRDEVFLISDFRPGEKLSLTVLDVNSSEAFCGSLSDIELKNLASNIRMEFDTFIKVTKYALKQHEYESLQFLYSLEKNCHGYAFKWKSVDSDETKVTIGVINMCAGEYQSLINDVFDHMSRELLSLNAKISKIETDLADSLKEKISSQELLAEAVNAKEKLEMELYSKFILVLNEKKRRIKELSKETARVPRKKAKTSDKSTKVTRKPLYQISDSDSDEVDDKVTVEDYDASTDDSNPKDVDSAETEVKAGPSNTKCNDSLFFSDDDDNIKVTVSPSKIRNRNTVNVPIINELSQQVQETYSKMYDSDSDDLLDQL